MEIDEVFILVFNGAAFYSVPVWAGSVNTAGDIKARNDKVKSVPILMYCVNQPCHRQ